MRAAVTEHHTGRTRIFAGAPDEVASDLRAAYPWLRRRTRRDDPPETICAALSHHQAYTASTDTAVSGVMLKAESEDADRFAQAGFHPAAERHRLAAAQLTGVSLDDVPAPRVEDARYFPEHLTGPVKIESESAEPPKTVRAFLPDGQAFADAVYRAAKVGGIHAVTLGSGKHSRGVLLAVDPETDRRILLKPGSGAQNPARGESQDPASQARREAAFYDAAVVFGDVAEVFPECRLLLLDDREYAAMPFLGAGWRDCSAIDRTEPGVARRVLALYLGRGYLHRWAAIDYVLGNPDRNAGNVMLRGTDVALIDAGSALAGPGFYPAGDPDVFTPYYLRALATSGFGDLAPETRQDALPRLNSAVAGELERWLRAVDLAVLGAALRPYGVDGRAEIGRSEALLAAVDTSDADDAVNAAWTTGIPVG